MKKLLLPLLLLLGCAGNEHFTITGTIKYKGASPHHYLALEDSKHHIFKIANPKSFHLDRMQNKVVTLKVKLIQKPHDKLFPAVVKVTGIKE